MANPYTPPVGNIVVVDGYNTIKKYALPNAQRSFPNGAPLWYNNIATGTGGVEPALLSTTANGYVATTASGTTYSSTYTTVELANAAFAPLFAGFAAEARLPQQLFQPGEFSGPVTPAPAEQDASRPFISVYDQGIAIGPLTTPVATNPVEPGTFVDLAGFANNATGFYDPAGDEQNDTKSYLYMNAVQTTTTAANAIGVVCERAPVGQTYLKFTFKSALLNPANVL